VFRRGQGRIFYFSPGHETHPVYHQPEVRQVIANAVRWVGVGPLPPYATFSGGVNVKMGWFSEPR
jgi:trehalose utilization protein